MQNLKCSIKAVYSINGMECGQDFNEELPLVGDIIIFKDGKNAQVEARIWCRDLDNGFQRNIIIRCKPFKFKKK
jgi:hypothetical protein